MRLTVGKQGVCDSSSDDMELCTQYDLTGLPGNHQFGSSFDILLTVDLAPSTAKVKNGCANVILSTDTDGDGYEFEVCSSGEADIFATTQCANDCAYSQQNAGNDMLFPAGTTRYVLDLLVQGTSYRWQITSGTQVQTLTATSKSVEKLVFIGLSPSYQVSSVNIQATTTFTDFEYKALS